MGQPARTHSRGDGPALQTAGRAFRFLLVRAAIAAFLFTAFAAQLRADTISGTVKDPSGAIVAGARVEITGDNLTQPVMVMSDGSGKFSAPNLSPGKYSVRVTKEGFEDLITRVDLHGTVDLPLSLAIAPQQTQVSVSGQISKLANSDPVYLQLRNIDLGDTYRVEDFHLPLDVGTLELESGTITLLKLVDGIETGVVFVGRGHFSLKPVVGIDVNEMMRRTGGPSAEEDITSAVFRFTRGEYPELAKALLAKTDTPAEAFAAFKDWKNSVRRRHDPPEGFTQAILEGDTMDNVDADLLAAIYDPQHPSFFNAYMHGTKHKDLRYFVRMRVGAIPQLDSPEEVALVNCAGAGMEDGVWYSQHLLSELKAGTASSLEDKRLFATRRYNIETDIGKNDHLYSRATITFVPLIAGERVMKFGLLPTLRVARVTDQDGHELHYIQEGKKEDGSFYAILDAAPEMGKEHSITVEYVGDKVLFNAGSGSYYVGARDSWYPNLNGFGERALYDLTFKVPPKNVVISVGNLVGQSSEGGFAVSHWVTPEPVTVAGFNYGQYKEIDFPDDITHYKLAGYYLENLPDVLVQYERGPLSGMAPGAMTKYALDQTRAQMQLCTLYFGRAPYDHVNITEQPNFAFGQSWPNLVYLPISAYIDSTQRWLLFGTIDQNFTGFVREVTPHEVAHQWFGHGVGWASYHDQWLSEGFAEFAAGLFLENAVPGKWEGDYRDLWERQRRRILDKNSFGVSPNEAGPLWLGQRLISPRSPEAYQGLTYSKGAYVLQMLRSLMYADGSSGGNPDQAFIDMMHDYMKTYGGRSASTETFIAIANKHMPKNLDIQRNGRLDWFFREWVYGTQVPRYQFKYEMHAANGGKFTVRAEITQSDVDNQFTMFVPVFADFGKGMVRLGQVEMVGNSARTIDFILEREPKKVALNYFKDVLER